MVEERAAIERRYADKLQVWYNKWSLAVKQGWLYLLYLSSFTMSILIYF